MYTARIVIMRDWASYCDPLPANDLRVAA